MIEGSCLCGRVRYRVASFRGSAAYCHCHMCQKAHGSAFGTYARVTDGGFTWLEGEDNVAIYQSSEKVKRTFCRSCGSNLQMIFFSKSGEIIDVALGTVDGDPGIRPTSHIFAAFKAAWHDIKDELPRKREWS